MKELYYTYTYFPLELQLIISLFWNFDYDMGRFFYDTEDAILIFLFPIVSQLFLSKSYMTAKGTIH